MDGPEILPLHKANCQVVDFDFITGSMLISKWILSTEEVNENDAHAELDEIARLVQNYLSDAREMNTATMTSMDSSFARAENEVVTDPTTCLRILECVKHVLFEKLRFKGNSSQYYKRSNSMLHQVNVFSRHLIMAISFILTQTKNSTKVKYCSTAFY